MAINQQLWAKQWKQFSQGTTILLKELEINQHNLMCCQIVMLKEGKMNIKTKSKGNNKQAFSNLVVPEKVMWVMCNWLAVAKDQMLVEDLHHMLALMVRRLVVTHQKNNSPNED